MESIFLTIIICTALIIIFNWWWTAQSNDFIYKNFRANTKRVEKIQEDLREIKEKLEIY